MLYIFCGLLDGCISSLTFGGISTFSSVDQRSVRLAGLWLGERRFVLLKLNSGQLLKSCLIVTVHRWSDSMVPTGCKLAQNKPLDWASQAEEYEQRQKENRRELKRMR